MNYFAMELLKIIVGCGLLVLVGYFLEKNNRIIAIILGLLSLLYFTEVSFAMTCSELTKFCEAKKAYYDERIALQTKNGWPVETNYVQCDLQTPPTPPGSKSRYIEYSNEYGGKNYLGSCALDPEKCASPKVKVGMEANGVDEKCACPSGTSSMDISYFNSDYSGSTDYLKKTHGKVGVCGSPPEGSKTPGRTDEQCCVSNLGCADGYKPDPTGAFIPTSPMATACVLDVPPPTECGEGFKVNPNYNPDVQSGSLACIEDISCPAGTEKMAAIETQPGLNFFGTMPNPRFPDRTGYCNDNYCCSGDNPNPLPTGESYCSQGTAIGFTDGEQSYADDSTTGGCTCPKNATHKSEGQYQSAVQGWSGASFLNKNASLSPLVCDYTKPPSDGTSADGEGLDTESIWEGKYDACAKYKDPKIPERTYDLCISMDQTMRDWIEDNVDCGTKKGMECLSAKMNKVMGHCHVVDGVVTCDQKYSPPEGVELPEAVIANSDEHGFPQHQIDDLFDTTGVDDDPTSNGGFLPPKSPATKNPNDLKPPEKKTEKREPGKSGSDLSSPKDSDFFNVWNSKLLTEQRSKYSEIINSFLKLTEKIKLPNIGGKLPCYDFDFFKAFKEGAEPKKVCFDQKPYVDILDILAMFVVFLTYLLPIIIFIRN